MTKRIDGSIPEMYASDFFARQVTENQFMRDLIEYAESKEWLVYHTHISKRSTAGFPDLCMARRGRLVFAELKREAPLLKNGEPSTSHHYHPSAAQVRWLSEVTAVGAKAGHGRVSAYLWRPSSWPTIERVLA